MVMPKQHNKTSSKLVQENVPSHYMSDLQYACPDVTPFFLLYDNISVSPLLFIEESHQIQKFRIFSIHFKVLYISLRYITKFGK